MREPERLAALKQAMDLIAEAVEQLPETAATSPAMLC